MCLHAHLLFVSAARIFVTNSGWLTVRGHNSPVGEAPATNPDALKHTVAGQLVHHIQNVVKSFCLRGSNLVHHEGGVEEKRRLVVVRHDATDEVGVGRVEGLNIKIRITNIVLY